MTIPGGSPTGSPIVMVSGSFPPRVCGIADYTARMAQSLRERGAPTTVVWTGEGEAEPQSGVVAPVATGWDAAGVRGLVRDLVDVRPALVHLQYERSIYNGHPAIALLFPLLLKRAHIPLVTTFHALEGPRIYGRAHRLALLPLLWGSRDLVVCSQRQLSALRRLPRALAHRATLIPVGSVIPVVHPRPSIRTPGPLRLVYFGFVWRGRHIEETLRALAGVRQSAEGAGATLEIVGGLRDAGYQAELTALAQTLNVASATRFSGALPAPEVSRSLAHADLVLLPYETGVSTGRTTLMAALSHAAPVVTFGVAENRSPLFRDGVNLSIAKGGDTADFVQRTLALACDPSLRARLSEGAALLAPSFDWPEIADQTLALPTYRAAQGQG